MNRYLAIYLNDHLAGATLGLERVRRAAREHARTEHGPFLRELAEEIETDYEALRAIMRDLRVPERRVKVAVAWAAEKAGRLKPNGHLLRRSPLTPLVGSRACASARSASASCGRRSRRRSSPTTFVRASTSWRRAPTARSRRSRLGVAPPPWRSPRVRLGG